MRNHHGILTGKPSYKAISEQTTWNFKRTVHNHSNNNSTNLHSNQCSQIYSFTEKLVSAESSINLWHHYHNAYYIKIMQFVIHHLYWLVVRVAKNCIHNHCCCCCHCHYRFPSLCGRFYFKLLYVYSTNTFPVSSIEKFKSISESFVPNNKIPNYHGFEICGQELKCYNRGERFRGRE